MRVSLINLNLIAKDAIGRSLMDKARYFRDRGDEVRIFVQQVSDDVPADVRALCVPCTLGQLMGHEPGISGRREHFFASDLYVYDYPNWYELVESICNVDAAWSFWIIMASPPRSCGGAKRRWGCCAGPWTSLPQLLAHADYALAIAPSLTASWCSVTACPPTVPSCFPTPCLWTISPPVSATPSWSAATAWRGSGCCST